MPSAQVVNFGPLPEDPYANAMGDFAKNAFNQFYERTELRRNDDLFDKISKKYGKDSDPTQLYKEVLESKGMNQSYKTDRLKDIKEYATLAAKSDRSAFENLKLNQRKDELDVRRDSNSIAKIRAENESSKITNQSTKNKQDLPRQIANYTKGLLKESGFNPEDIADINEFVHEQMEDTENPVSMDEAFKKAYQFKSLQKDLVEDVKFIERVVPSTEKFGASLRQDNSKEYEVAFQQAEAVLQKLHDEDGITSQKDLRKIAQRGGWKPEEITKMLQNVFRRNGKKLRGKQPTAQESAQIPLQKQGQASQTASVDDLLFGE